MRAQKPKRKCVTVCFLGSCRGTRGGGRGDRGPCSWRKSASKKLKAQPRFAQPLLHAHVAAFMLMSERFRRCARGDRRRPSGRLLPKAVEGLQNQERGGSVTRRRAYPDRHEGSAAAAHRGRPPRQAEQGMPPAIVVAPPATAGRASV
jgi:hypothetical protein